MFQKFLINLNSFLFCQSLQIGTLYIPYNLYTIQIKMIEKILPVEVLVCSHPEQELHVL